MEPHDVAFGAYCPQSFNIQLEDVIGMDGLWQCDQIHRESVSG